MTIVPRTGPRSTSCALMTTSLYQAEKSSLCGVTPSRLTQARVPGRQPLGGLRGKSEVECDLDLVGELEGAEERRVGLDAELRLDHGRAAVHLVAVADRTADRDRAGLVEDVQVALDGERLRRAADLHRLEGDRRVPVGVEDLALEGPLDLGTVAVGQRLDPAGALA